MLDGAKHDIESIFQRSRKMKRIMRIGLVPLMLSLVVLSSGCTYSLWHGQTVRPWSQASERSGRVVAVDKSEVHSINTLPYLLL